MSLAAPAQRPLCNLPLGHSYSQSATTVLDRPKHSQTSFLLQIWKQSKTDLTDICTQFLIDDVYIKYLRLIPHTFCCLFVTFFTKMWQKLFLIPTLFLRFYIQWILICSLVVVDVVSTVSVAGLGGRKD